MISFANLQDIPELVRLWKEAFGEEESAKRFYGKAFDEEAQVKIIVERKDDMKIVSMLHYISCSMKVGNSKYDGVYLYALATDKEYRGCGIMSGLIQYAKQIAKEEKKRFLYLIPANEELYNYYEGQGFESILSRTVMYETIQNTECSIGNIDCEQYKKHLLKPWKKVCENMTFSIPITEYTVGELFYEEDFCGYEVVKNDEVIAYYGIKDGQVCYYGENEDIIVSKETDIHKKNGCIFLCQSEKIYMNGMEIKGYIPY